ncbi:hypothetical protein C8R42DRAFT_714942 [Lentinula raphanica]|nr:hypothetical protein C8R42DRAFT_714942 [Lentinula raphanica]
MRCSTRPRCWDHGLDAEMPQAQEMARRADSQESSITMQTGVTKRASATGSRSGYTSLPSPSSALDADSEEPRLPSTVQFRDHVYENTRRDQFTFVSAADGLPAPSSSSHPLPDSRTSNRASIRAGGGLITSSRAHAAERSVERERLAQLRASGQTGARFRVRGRPPLAEDMHFVGLFRHDSPDFFDPFETIGYNGLVRYGPGFVHLLATQKTGQSNLGFPL